MPFNIDIAEWLKYELKNIFLDRGNVVKIYILMDDPKSGLKKMN